MGLLVSPVFGDYIEVTPMFLRRLPERSSQCAITWFKASAIKGMPGRMRRRTPPDPGQIV